MTIHKEQHTLLIMTGGESPRVCLGRTIELSLGLGVLLVLGKAPLEEYDGIRRLLD